MKLLIKAAIFYKKPKIVVLDQQSLVCVDAVYNLLKSKYKVRKFCALPKLKDMFLIFKNDVLIFCNINDLKFLLKNYSVSILVSQNQDINASDYSHLVVNSDNVKPKKRSDVLSFGTKDEEVDFFISDITQENDINFKVSHRGNTIPFWLNASLDKESIFDVMPALCIGTILNLNLVEISNFLKSYNFDIYKKELTDRI